MSSPPLVELPFREELVEETPSPFWMKPQVKHAFEDLGRRDTSTGSLSPVAPPTQKRATLTGCPFPWIRRIVGRMPRLQVYLPDDLYDELKRRELPASELLQVAVRAELERRSVLDATDDYLTELAATVGEPTERQQTRADAIVRRIRDRQLHEAG